MHMHLESSRKVSLELCLLGTLALVDAITTLYLLGAGLAEEANPVARFYVQMGPIWFIGLKMIPVALMAFIEIRRFMDRRRMMLFMRVGLAIYAGVYVSGMLAQYGRFSRPKQNDQIASYQSRLNSGNSNGAHDGSDPRQD
jgi:hypothetical protein